MFLLNNHGFSNLQTIEELRLFQPQKHFFAVHKINPFISDMSCCQDVIINFVSQHPIEEHSVERILGIDSQIVAGSENLI